MNPFKFTSRVLDKTATVIDKAFDFVIEFFDTGIDGVKVVRHEISIVRAEQDAELAAIALPTRLEDSAALPPKAKT